MNKLQQARFEAYQLTLEHLEANLAIAKTIPVFEMIINSARLLLDTIYHIDRQLLINPGGETDRKELETNNLASMAFRFSSALLTYSSIKQDVELRKRNLFSLTKLKEAPAKLKGISENILTDAKKLAAGLEQYGISTLMIENFAQMIDAYGVVVTAPRKAEALKSQDVGRLAELLSEASRIFKEQIKTTMVQFKDSHIEFYQDYLNLRKVVNPYTTYTRINVLAKDKNGNPVKGAAVQVEGTEFAGITDEDGLVTMKVPMTGDVVIQVSKEGYSRVTVEKTLTRGSMVRIRIVL
ncbi:MAG: carboxypeptidase regulatory-like domain-containing protein [Chitinophagaceae bacterium]|nr:carboxypeptidase regulatory-like domain-containing protein [Chitinophagaceae bacterium]